MENQINKSLSLSGGRMRHGNISVIIPAYNEEGNIEEVVRICEKVFSSFFNDNFEIIVVNDGSGDKTGEIAGKLMSSVKNLKVFHHQKNQGMGKAVKTGVCQAQNDLIFVTGSDLQFDIREFEKFLPFIDNSDIVIGYRVNRKYGFFRKFNTAVYHFLINLMFGLKFRDPSWVKLFRKKIFDNIAITSNGFFWDVELLIKAKRKGYKIKEVGVHSYERKTGKASGKNIFKIFETFLSLVRVWWKVNFEAPEKKISLLFIFLLIVITVIFWLPTIDTPFWWDSAGFVVHAARYYLENNFNSFILPSDATISAIAHPPLFAFLLALTWKIFGDSLLVSHLFYLPFIILAVIFTYLLGKKIANSKNKTANHLVGFSAALLLFFTPLFLAQVGIVYPEIPTAAFGVMTVYFFLKRRFWWYIISGGLMLFMKEGSVVIILAILVTVLIRLIFGIFKREKINFKRILKELLVLSSPILILVVWFIWHKTATGWMFIIPSAREDFAEKVSVISFPRIFMVLRYFFLTQGRTIISYSILALLFFIFLKFLTKRTKEIFIQKDIIILFLVIIFVPLLFGILEFLPRYIIFGLPFLFIIFSYLIAFVFQKKAILVSIFSFLILLGIFSFYWDTHQKINYWRFPPIEENLEYLDIIDVGRDMAGFIETNYPDATVYTAFPSSYMLSEPFQHYVSKPINVQICTDYQEGDEVDLVVFHLLSPPEMACSLIIKELNLSLLASFEKNGKWMKIYKNQNL